MKKGIRITAAALAVLCTVIMAFTAIGDAVMPESLVSYGDSNRLSAVYTYSQSSEIPADSRGSVTVSETIRAFGIFPVKTVKVTKTQAPVVRVSGEVFGIKLYTDGVMVVGLQSVDTGGGKCCPAKESGIDVGDVVTAVNDVPVFTSDEVTALLGENNGLPCTVKLRRGERYKTFTVTPAYSPREGSYKAGMWVRDSTAGIGTLTFYNEQSGSFAALGHPVNDIDTNTLMPLLDGEAVAAEVTGVQKATAGGVGSLSCEFHELTLGRLYENGSTGLYGAYSRIPDGAKEFTVASKQEVQKGYAQILSTVEGAQPKAYDIEITRISYHRGGEQKDIVFKVTDKDLLDKTGGIVQGMSGSPVIQNDKLVGAVTHVVVGNPQKGYAVFAQTMYEKSLQ